MSLIVFLFSTVDRHTVGCESSRWLFRNQLTFKRGSNIMFPFTELLIVTAAIHMIAVHVGKGEMARCRYVFIERIRLSFGV